MWWMGSWTFAGRCHCTTKLGTIVAKHSWLPWESWLGNPQGCSWNHKYLSSAFKHFDHGWSCFYTSSTWGLPLWQGIILNSFFFCAATPVFTLLVVSSLIKPFTLCLQITFSCSQWKQVVSCLFWHVNNNPCLLPFCLIITHPFVYSISILKPFSWNLCVCDGQLVEDI